MWSVEYLNDIAEAEVEVLPRDTRASCLRIVDMIRANGLERMREPYVKHLKGKIWEMGLKGRDGIARSLYVTATGRRVIVLRICVKKTETTPFREIEIALRRAKEIWWNANSFPQKNPSRVGGRTPSSCANTTRLRKNSRLQTP